MPCRKGTFAQAESNTSRGPQSAVRRNVTRRLRLKIIANPLNRDHGSDLATSALMAVKAV